MRPNASHCNAQTVLTPQKMTIMRTIKFGEAQFTVSWLAVKISRHLYLLLHLQESHQILSESGARLEWSLYGTLWPSSTFCVSWLLVNHLRCAGPISTAVCCWESYWTFLCARKISVTFCFWNHPCVNLRVFQVGAIFLALDCMLRSPDWVLHCSLV